MLIKQYSQHDAKNCRLLMLEINWKKYKLTISIYPIVIGGYYHANRNEDRNRNIASNRLYWERYCPWMMFTHIK